MHIDWESFPDDIKTIFTEMVLTDNEYSALRLADLKANIAKSDEHTKVLRRMVWTEAFLGLAIFSMTLFMMVQS